MDTAQEIERVFGRVYAETMYALERSRPGERVTIFLSAPLFSYSDIAHRREILYRVDPNSELPSVKMFGCNVEVYADSKLSFYVTTAMKYEFN
jgi:hypothetical protein